jgi:hypothetical protein
MTKKKPTQAEVDALFAEMRRLIDATNAAAEAYRQTAEYKHWSATKDMTDNARVRYNRAKDLLHGPSEVGSLPQR